MKFTCSRSELFDTLQLVSSIVPTRAVKPILEGVRVRVDAKENRIELATTDLDVSMRFQVQAQEITEPGEVVLPASRMAGLLRELPHQPVRIDANLQNCTIKCGRGVFKVLTADPAEFPELPTFEKAASVDLQSAMLREIGARTIFATARDRSQYALNGVLLVIRGETLDAVGSDGRRLALERRVIENPTAFELRAIVPTGPLTLFERGIGPEEKVIKLTSTASHVALRSARGEIAARLVEGEYPDYEKVVPEKGTTQVTLDVEEFEKALRQAGQLTSARTRTVKLQFSEKTLIISSQTPELGEATVEVDAVTTGPGLGIGFNPDYLLEALKVIGGGGVERKEIRFELTSRDRAGVLHAGETFTYVVMPMSLD